MAIVVVGAEKNFAALRPRLFSGRVSNQAAGRVADALREANPHVDLDALTPGTVLTVPDLPEVSIRGGLSFDEITTRGIDVVFAHAADTLRHLVETADRRLGEDAAERKVLVRSMGAREVKAAETEDSALADDVAATRRAVAEEEALAKDRAAWLERAQAEWGAQLDELRSVLP
jgi:hypothetical protein